MQHRSSSKLFATTEIGRVGGVNPSGLRNLTAHPPCQAQSPKPFREHPLGSYPIRLSLREVPVAKQWCSAGPKGLQVGDFVVFHLVQECSVTDFQQFRRPGSVALGALQSTPDKDFFDNTRGAFNAQLIAG